MVNKISCNFRCGNISHRYLFDHFGEPLGADKEMLVTSLGLDKISEYFDDGVSFATSSYLQGDRLTLYSGSCTKRFA